jgi:hypothetical protein
VGPATTGTSTSSWSNRRRTTTVASSAKVRFYGAAGVTRVQSSLNSTLSKNANALTILSSRIVRNQAYVFAYGFASRAVPRASKKTMTVSPSAYSFRISGRKGADIRR